MQQAGRLGAAAFGAVEPELDTSAAWGTFCHFRRCRSPLLMLLQVEGRRALLNIYNHLPRIYNNDDSMKIKGQAL